MDFRLAEECDLSQIVEIYNHAIEQRGATADLTPISHESRRQWFRDHTPSTLPIWVAEEGRAILGWCGLSAHRPGRMAVRHTAEISCYIHRGHRRQGVATALLQYAIDQCPHIQIKQVFGYVIEDNVASIRNIEKLGFAKWGHMPDVVEFDGKTCAHLIYGRRV